MALRSIKPSPRALKGAALGIALSLVASYGFAQRGESPFAGMSGAWSGGGTITVSNGTNERIRCRATYVVANSGNSLQQDLRCASDSYRFMVVSNVSYDGGTISGSWTEQTRNASGNVTGRAGSGQIWATVAGFGFTAELAVITRGNAQSVTIRPSGTDVTNVSINLRRG